MDLHPNPDGNGAAAPTLAIAGVTKARCPTCHAEYTWTDPDFAIPTCVRCQTPTVITAATGETIAQAIAAAAQVIPEQVERPVQPSIPGLKPIFNFESAYNSIIDKRRELRGAEVATALKAEAHKTAKKREDTIRAELSQMLDDFEERHSEWYGKTDGDSLIAGPSVSGEAVPDATRSEAPVGEPQTPTLSSSVPNEGDSGQLDPSNAATLTLLHQAGADRITLDQVEAWSEAQYTEARAWALEQIEARASAEPGTVVSVQWPEHVSRAHHGPEYGKHIPTKRTKKTKARKGKAR